MGTDLSARELETHFAVQFQAAGWTRIDSGADELGSSPWHKADRGVQGLLFILEGPAPRKRTLYARATTGPGMGGWVAMSTDVRPR